MDARLLGVCISGGRGFVTFHVLHVLTGDFGDATEGTSDESSSAALVLFAAHRAKLHRCPYQAWGYLTIDWRQGLYVIGVAFGRLLLLLKSRSGFKDARLSDNGIL